MIRRVLPFLLLSAGPVLGGEVGLWSVDSLTRVFREDPARPQVEPVVSAARGEWESFQIVLTGAPQDVAGARIESTPPRSDADAQLPSPTVFREHYVRVSEVSPQSPMQPGDYPDALVPQSFPEAALPDLESLNQPFWVDVFVPYASAAGRYDGTLVVRLKDGSTQTLSYRVEVRDFDLPVVPTMRSSFWLGWRRVAEVHGYDRDSGYPPPELAQLLDAYEGLLAQHRLAIDQVRATFPDANTGRLTNREQIDRALRRQLLHRHASAIGLPIFESWPFEDPLGRDRGATMQYLADWMQLVEDAHGKGRGYIALGPLDEPNDAEAYETVRQWGAMVNEAEALHGIRLPLMITEQPTPDDDAWGDLFGAVDIWVPHFSSVYEDMEHPTGRRDIEKRIAEGEEVWTYAALVQLSELWKEEHGYPETVSEGHPPVWLTDFPVINHRIVPWLMALHGINGMTYWDMLYFPEGVDPWQDAGSFIGFDNGSTYNGDGLFIYPATQDQHGVDLPVASMRLKWIRDSAEDFDYLTLAREAGHAEAVLSAMEPFARGFGDWNDDRAALLRARSQIAELLSAPSSP